MLWEAQGPAPTVFYALPELHYLPRFNAAQVLLEEPAARGLGSRRVLLHQGTSLSHDDVREQVNRYAAALRGVGVTRGDRVLLRLADSPELVYATLAAFQLGAIAIPTYTQYRTDDLRYRIDDAGVSVVVVGRELLPELEQAVAGRRDVAVLVAPDAEPGRFLSLERLIASSSPLGEYANTDADELALILYTSGSTGRPKGACHSHADLLAVCDSYARFCASLGPGDVIAGPPAMPFALGIGFFMLFPLRLGCTAIIDADKSPARWLDLAQRHHATLFVAVATYYHMVLSAMRKQQYDLDRVSRYLCGGEPLTEELARAWEQQTGKRLSQFLGTTELLHCFLGFRHGEDEVRTNGIGRPVPGYEVVVRDSESFAPLPPGQHGLLTVRGPTGTKYWHRPDKQREAVVEGWNVVPDIVWAGEDGVLHFVARADEVIKSAGIRISPTQAEDALLRHEAVDACVCVAAPDPQGIRPSVVKAYVVLAKGFEPTDTLVSDLQRFVKETAAPYLYPRVVQFLEHLPTTSSGKIKRLELREHAWRGQAGTGAPGKTP